MAELAGGFGSLRHSDAVVTYRFEEQSPIALGLRQGIRHLSGESAREHTGVLPLFDILSTSLDKVACEFRSERFLGVTTIIAQRRELRSQQ